jgi:hypothetical protein
MTIECGAVQDVFARPGLRESPSVVAGLDPAIHLLRKTSCEDSMDARIKSGHDECLCVRTNRALDNVVRRHTFAISPRVFARV